MEEMRTPLMLEVYREFKPMVFCWKYLNRLRMKINFNLKGNYSVFESKMQFMIE
jgi:hypothetical protein